MDISEIIKTLDKWNFWNQKVDTGFRRSFYLEKLERLMRMPEVIAITGVRRSGKSVIILQIIEDLIEKGVHPKNTLYVNFEEPNFSDDLNVKFLVRMFDAYLEAFAPKGKMYLFLDEVQMVSGWERFVVSLYDRKVDIKIFVTGSSSKLLTGEISTLLSGRYISEVVYPLGFKEFMDFKKEDYSPFLIKSPKLYNYLREYIEFGGFPRVITESDVYGKRLVLMEYFNSILEKDVLLRHKIRNTKDVSEVANFAMANIASQISSYRMGKDLGIASLSARRYFGYFEESFLLQFTPFFSYSVKKQIYNPQKVFSIDTGLRNAVSFKFSSDIGKLLENIVLLEFLRRKKVLYYWENKKTEIDFVLRRGHEVSELVNVCYLLNNKSLEREMQSLEDGMAEFKRAKAKIIYWEGEPPKHKKIEFVNILDFLLDV
ncbi:MAG: hypothetical protein COX30_00080 [Candidatus Moranbacteria bacterium CG23_combo_of_CG06-09_8_20_14_all_39_10]|nr:ATP-binding protein [bacterium]PIP27764.1 MAG: hypothetical protein COX30_00080 [Candidatus Moranbacteria bacterium CG23_combo_of_CG06-09_8_20_14_all_39_10]